MSVSSGTATCASGATLRLKKRGRSLPYYALFIAFLLGAALVQRDGGKAFPTAQRPSTAKYAQIYAALPLSFEANRGQIDSRVDFLSRGGGFTLFLSGGDAVLTLRHPVAGKSVPPARSPLSALRLKLIGANPHAAVTGENELPGKANYFIGNDRGKWRTDVPTYSKVTYQNVYPGIDLVYYGTQGGQLEYDFVVAPGADPKPITLGVQTRSTAALRVNPDGTLVIPLSAGDVQLHKPIVYQKSAAGSPRAVRRAVEGHYVVDAQNRVQFQLGPYDHSQPLVIDPVLVYATYLGGTGGDEGYGITVDSNLDAYIAGVTNSSDFPTFSPYQEYQNNGDCFVTKVNSAGTKLLYSTYLGGSQADACTAIAVSNGSAYVTGYTNSPNFPTLAAVSSANPLQMLYAGDTDAFVTEISTLGNALVYSTFLGGTGADFGQGIAADSTGYAYVTGSTQSTNFPLSTNALQTILNGSQNAFVSKIDPTGETVAFSTYLGGSSADVGQAIQIDPSDDMFVAGYTFSTNFLTANPPTNPPLQGVIGGGSDAFITEIKHDYSGIPFSTFLGGSGDDRAFGIALDSSFNVYVVGTTSSANFPTTGGVFQTSLRGASNAFVTELNSAGSSLTYSTYLGGTGIDNGNAIAVTPGGIAFVTGSTTSTDFPTQSPIQALLGITSTLTYCGTNPCPDAFVTQLSAGGKGLVYSTYLGGNGYDSGQGIAVDSTPDPYITGSTDSTNFPAIYGGSYQSSLTGTAGNAFVAKIDVLNNPTMAIVPNKLNFGNEAVNVTSSLQPIYIINPSTAPLTITSIAVGEVGNTYSIFQETDDCVGTIPGGGAYCIMYVSFTPQFTGNVTDQITIYDNAGGYACSSGNITSCSQQTISLTGFGNTSATAVTLNPSALSFNTQTVGTVSAPQQVKITNTGTLPLDISSISLGTSTDFAWTSPSCQALGDILQVNQSCIVSITFTPIATGTRGALLAFTDNAAGSPQTVSLTGTGQAAFSITAPSSSLTTNPALIGATTATFELEALGPNNYTASISLTCSSGTTCAFSTNPILVGQTTTLTLSNLTTSLPNPYIFTVTGTSGSQTTTLQLSLEFEDFTLSVSPSIDTIQAGSTATYNVLINPLYGFNQQLQLSCYQGVPSEAICTFNPSSTPTPTGNGPTSVQLSISTVKYIPTSTHAPPRLPPGPLPPLIIGLLSLAALASLAMVNKRRRTRGWLGSGWLGVRLATLSLIMVWNLALVACRSSTLVVSGTTTGNYTITIAGTLVNNTAVLHTTTMGLAVTSEPITQ